MQLLQTLRQLDKQLGRVWTVNKYTKYTFFGIVPQAGIKKARGSLHRKSPSAKYDLWTTENR